MNNMPGGSGVLSPDAGPGVIGMPKIPTAGEAKDWLEDMMPGAKEKKAKEEAERKKRIDQLTGKN